MIDALELIIVVLALVFIAGSQVFWMRNVQRLIDKNMSRSYHEVVLADKVKIEATAKTKEDVTQLVIKDDYAAEQAERANRAFGL